MAPITPSQAAPEAIGACLEQFPPIRHAFAYGSGVFNQPGLYQADGAGPQPMLDFIFVVDSPKSWHQENIIENRSHYSFLASFGASAVAAGAEQLGAGVHFNTLVPWKSRLIKYGVVGRDTLQRDLLEWDSLYVAGRMHKPVLTLREDAAVAEAAGKNLQSAVRTALLLLPRQFTTQELLHAICGISYLGDVRQGIAEDRGKVGKIVSGSSAALLQLYSGSLEGPAAASGSLEQITPGVWRQDCSDAGLAHLVSELPQAVISGLAARLGSQTPSAATCSGLGGAAERNKAVAEAVLGTGQHRALLSSTIGSIVRRSSARQTAYGALAVGASKSARYLAAKLAKAWKPTYL